MLQITSKTLGFKKIKVYKTPPGGGGKPYLARGLLTGDHLCGKLLFTWLSLVVSMMVPFCAAFFPRDALDEIWDLIESVFEGFPKYSYDIKYVSFMIQKKYKMSTIIDILTPLALDMKMKD